MKTTLLFCASILLFISCEKEDEMEDNQTEEQYISVIENTENWESVAFSEAKFSGTMGYNFESDISYFDGGIESGLPTFRAKHEWSTQSANWSADRFHVVAGNLVYDYDLPYDLRDESASQIPTEVYNEFTSGTLDAVRNTYFRHDGKLWSQGTVLDERFGGPFPIYGISLLKGGNAPIYAWLHRYKYTDFPSGYLAPVAEPETDFVDFNNIGTIDIITENGEDRIYFMTDFNSLYNGNSEQRGIICKKIRDSEKVDIDEIAILPFSPSIAASSFPQYRTFSFNENQVFSTFFNNAENVIEIYSGNMTDGFELHENLENVQLKSALKGDNEFFLFYTEGEPVPVKVRKYHRNGEVTDLGEVEYGIYSHYNGNLVVGTENNSGEIHIYEVTGNGSQQDLASVGDLDVGDLQGVNPGELIAFASNGNQLFVAVKNWKSPIFRGRYNQFGGWEIIKYKN